MKQASRTAIALASLLLARTPALLAAAPVAPQRPIAGATLVNGIDPMEASKYLGTIYKKEADGFRIVPPAGSRFINRQGVDLVSFVVDAKSWGGSLQRISLKDPITLDDFIATTKADITRDNRAPITATQPDSLNIFKAVQILEDKRLKWGPDGKYDAARFSFSAQVDLGPLVAQGIAEQLGMQKTNGVQTVSILRQELVVRIRDGLFMVLMFYTPLSDREVATRTWELMVPEFELFDKAEVVKRRNDAARVGREWLAQRSAEELRAKIINEPQFYRMTVGAKDVGFFHFNELTRESGPGGALTDVTRDGHKGVLLTVNLISFGDQGDVNMGQNEAFWGFSKDAKGDLIPAYSSWLNTSETKTKTPIRSTVIAAAAGRPGVAQVQEIVPWRQEQGILSQTGLPGPKVPFQINIVIAGDKTQKIPGGVSAIIPLEAAPPLPKVLEYTWTRFVDLNTPSEMTFSAFDSKSSKMSTRNLIVTGKKENVNIDGKVESCYKCIDEVDPNSTTLWVDSSGRIRSMVTSDQSVMVPTTEAAMKTRWARQLADAGPSLHARTP